MREIFKRSNPKSIEMKIENSRVILSGWWNYFSLTESKSALTQLDSFIRKRVRINAWSQWKRIRTRYKMLRRLNVNHDKAYQWANSSKGKAKVASSPILQTTLTTCVLTRMGLISLEANFTFKHQQTKLF
jgi:RNA-directed DNA polymerase